MTEKVKDNIWKGIIGFVLSGSLTFSVMTYTALKNYISFREGTNDFVAEARGKFDEQKKVDAKQDDAIDANTARTDKAILMAQGAGSSADNANHRIDMLSIMTNSK